eukprot:574857-Pyramimonas_sp.AAC.1
MQQTSDYARWQNPTRSVGNGLVSIRAAVVRESQSESQLAVRVAVGSQSRSRSQSRSQSRSRSR